MFPAGHVGNKELTTVCCGGAVVDVLGAVFAGGAVDFAIVVDAVV